MISALICMLILVRAVVAALRRADMLTGDVNEDRRRVLSTLASLGLASLVGAGQPADAEARTFARPIWRRARSSVGYQQDLADASMMVMSTRVFHWFRNPSSRTQLEAEATRSIDKFFMTADEAKLLGGWQ